ncbi:MAG: methylisocitrate lyase [Gemmataceae bacterium]
MPPEIPTAGARLRSLWAKKPLRLPGVFSPFVGQMAESLGFQAAYLSGGALSAGSGVPDIGLLSLAEFTQAIQSITQATKLPLLCDADTGFGEALNVERTVRLYEAAGAAGLHLEDQELPKRCGHLSGKSLVSTEVLVAKIRAAVAARRDPSFVILARTDARGVLGYTAAVERAKACLAAGADGIFPEALENEAEFAQFAKDVPGVLLANMTEFGKGPLIPAPRLAELGYTMVLYPLTAFRAAMKAAEETLRDLLQNGTQQNSVPRMLTRAELYDYLGYNSYDARDRAYFGTPTSPASPLPPPPATGRQS